MMYSHEYPDYDLRKAKAKVRRLAKEYTYKDSYFICGEEGVFKSIAIREYAEKFGLRVRVISHGVNSFTVY